MKNKNVVGFTGLLLVLIGSGCAHKTLHERCTQNEEWKRYGSLAECKANIQKDSPTFVERMKILGDGLQEIGEDERRRKGQYINVRVEEKK